MPRKTKVRLPEGWKAELITDRMKKICEGCGQVPDGVYRLIQRVDGYPFPTTRNYCCACGVVVMRQSLQQAEQLIREFEEHHGSPPR